MVREMMARGMTALTKEKTAEDAWHRFFDPYDVVGIKVNCSGAPKVCSDPVVVAEIVRIWSPPSEAEEHLHLRALR